MMPHCAAHCYKLNILFNMQMPKQLKFCKPIFFSFKFQMHLQSLQQIFEQPLYWNQTKRLNVHSVQFHLQRQLYSDFIYYLVFVHKVTFRFWFLCIYLGKVMHRDYMYKLMDSSTPGWRIRADFSRIYVSEKSKTWLYYYLQVSR